MALVLSRIVSPMILGLERHLELPPQHHLFGNQLSQRNLPAFLDISDSNQLHSLRYRAIATYRMDRPLEDVISERQVRKKPQTTPGSIPMALSLTWIFLQRRGNRGGRGGGRRPNNFPRNESRKVRLRSPELGRPALGKPEIC